MSTKLYDPTQCVSRSICLNGENYDLKLKINLRDTQLSTAKLIRNGQTNEILSKCITWQGIENIRRKKIPVHVEKATECIKVTSFDSPERPFELTISLNSADQEALRKERMRILRIKTLEDYKQLFHLCGKAPELFFKFEHLSDLFKNLHPWRSSYTSEMINFSEFLTERDQKLMAQELLKMSSYPKINNEVRGGKAPVAETSFDTSNQIADNAKQILDNTQQQEVMSIKSTQVPICLFEVVLRQKFPWIRGMQKQLQKLNEDRQLIEDRPYIIELRGSRLGISGELKGFLRDSLLNLHKWILIIGGPGAGKTLLLKNYLQEILENYQPKQPLPIYISCGSIPEPEVDLIQKILRVHELEDCEKKLKKIPTIWFLDAYDEMFLGTTKKFFNIASQFNNWPMAQFVYTCRSALKITEIDFFSPCGKKAIVLKVSPFQETQIKQFLDKFTQVKSELGETTWSADDYHAHISNFELMEISQTPFFLKIIADYFPTLNTQLNFSPNSSKEDKQKILLNLLTFELIKKLVIREARKTTKLNPSDYLNYAFEISKLMKTCQLCSVPEKDSKEGVEARRSRGIIKYGLEKDLIKERDREAQINKELAEQQDSNKIHECQNSIQKISQDLEEIKKIEESETRLQTLLFGEKYKHLWTDALIVETPNGTKEFAHTRLYEYFEELTQETNSDQREKLLKMIDEIKLEEEKLCDF